MTRRLLTLGLLPVLLVVFGLGLLLRPPLDSVLVRPDLSIHESRANLRDWKVGPLQVVVTQWRLTGEVDRDQFIWLWRIVVLNAAPFAIAISSNECGVRVTRFSLRDSQGFDVAVGEAAPQTTAVRGGETASVSGSGRLARVRMSPKLHSNWELQTTCPQRLPGFGEAKITEILETVAEGRPRSIPQRFFLRRTSEDADSRRVGPVAKVRAQLWSRASYIREIQDLECENDPQCLRRREAGRKDLGASLDAVFNSPVAIQIQFPRGAKLRVGDVIYTFDQRFVQDEAGVRNVGYGFTADGASLPLRHWHDARDGG